MSLQRFFRRYECVDCSRLYRLENGRESFTCPKCKKECAGIGGHKMKQRWASKWMSGHTAFLKGVDGKLTKVGKYIGAALSKSARKKKT